jgi:predicted N-acetyltransferase YhbS
MTYAGVARNSSEREQALSLAAESFSQAGSNPNVAVLRKAFLVREHPGYSDKSPIIVCTDDGCVVGSAFLIDCTLPMADRLLQGVFISSVSVADSHRSQGFSVLLMEAAVDAAISRGIDVAMIIARRAVDGFYTRFGFWGVAQYSKVTLRVATLPTNMFPKNLIDLRPVGAADIKTCGILHAENYRNLVGYCLRTSEMWDYIFRKVPYIGLRFDMIKINNEIAGYAIHDGQGNLHEVATSQEVLACDARNFLEAFMPDGESVTLHMPPTHPLSLIQK